MVSKSLKSISVIIPAFNEEATIGVIIRKIIQAKVFGLKKEIIVVNDGSRDGTVQAVKKLKTRNLKLVSHHRNQGKESAIKTGLKKAGGDIILIQDADLEYDPKDYPILLKPILQGASVVYGSRELSGQNIHSSVFFHAGGKLVTFLTNFLYGSHLTDEATGYKLFLKDVIKNTVLKGNGFEFCPEVTARILKNKIQSHCLSKPYS